MSSEEQREFFERYAPIAMQQQQKYGIPASVTLAQMALESGFGSSRLSREGNNYFGIKVHGEYNSAGRYGYYSDDRPNEKFCHYSSVEESVQDHSRILMGSRYSRCHSLSSTDYHGWISGIKAAGYATDPNYVASIEKKINDFNLSQYDKLAVAQATQPIGYMRSKGYESSVPDNRKMLTYEEGHWAMPISLDEKNGMKVTSDYGKRTRPNAQASSNHKGVDISARGNKVYATEDNGVVTRVHVFNPQRDSNGKLPSSELGGTQVTVEYNRADGTKYECTYMHLSEVGVEKGGSVMAGSDLGVTGTTGNTNGEHLHFSVKKNGESIDPAEYLAEIAVRGNIDCQLNYSGKDLMAEYKTKLQLNDQLVDPNSINTQNLLSQTLNTNDPLQMLRYLMTKDKNQDAASLGSSGDILADIAGVFLNGIIMLSTQYAMENGVEQVTDKQEETEADETKISPSTLIERQRSSVSPSQASHQASMNYDTQISEQSSERSLRIS